VSLFELKIYTASCSILSPESLSPKRNPNLLQRSEIVALINTMHRLSESLYAVETFRKMYAETQKMEREKLAALESQSATVQVSLGRIDGAKGEMLMFQTTM
jgi:hypothetical protein